MQSNTTFTITLNSPVPNSTRQARDHKELQSLNPAFFPLGCCYEEYFANGAYCLLIEDNHLTVCTDHNSYPDFGAIWLISEDRLTLIYSHTEDDL
jgi:hypothetical protein